MSERSVILRDDAASLEATFMPGAGMLCASLKHRGEELLGQRGGVEAYAQRGKTMGIPLLFPWANRLAGFEYTVRERTVGLPDDPEAISVDGHGLPMHGVVPGRLRWELAGEPDGAALAARLSWRAGDAELFDAFPFCHELLYAARLAGGRLEIRVIVDACGEDAVPVSFGFHPYLTPGAEPRERWTVELPAMRELVLDAEQIPVASGARLDAARFELESTEFDDGYEDVDEQAVFAVESGGRRIELAHLGGYRHTQVYAPADAKFICFEPMTAPANALRSGDALVVVEPGGRYEARFAVAVS